MPVSSPDGATDYRQVFSKEDPLRDAYQCVRTPTGRRITGKCSAKRNPCGRHINVSEPRRGDGCGISLRLTVNCLDGKPPLSHCRRNASKRHHLNNPRQTKCSLGIRVLSLVSVSERRHHINEFFACPEPVFGRDQLRSLYNICTILVQYLYVYQLYKYCTTIVHILYNCRSRYSQNAEIETCSKK